MGGVGAGTRRSRARIEGRWSRARLSEPARWGGTGCVGSLSVEALAQIVAGLLRVPWCIRGCRSRSAWTHEPPPTITPGELP